MIRPLATLPSLAALLAAGCIENPGVDPGVGRPDPTRETFHVQAPFRGANFLQLRVSADSGRTSLLAANRGLADIDSATFLLQAMNRGKSPNYLQGWGFDPAPDFEYYGKVRSLPPGATADFGIIDTLLLGKLSDYYLIAVVIQVTEDGSRRGSPFGGVFTGKHRGTDSAGKPFEGPLRGLVSADGEFRFAIHNPRNEPLGVLSGVANDSGALVGRFTLGYQNPGKSGRLFPHPEGFGGSFSFRDSVSRVDTLDIDYQPFSPR